MKSRNLPWIAIVLATIGSAHVSSQSGEPCPNGFTTNPQESSLIVGAGQSKTFECEVLIVDGDVIVEAGGTLTLKNVGIVLDSSAPGTIRKLIVRTGGILQANTTKVTSFEESRFFAVVESDATAVLGVFGLENADSFTIASTKATMEGLLVENSRGTALTVRADAAIRGLEIAGALNGLKLENGAHVALEDALVTDVALTAVALDPGAQFLAERVHLEAENLALYARGDSRVTVRNGSLVADRHARLEAASGKSPNLILQGTTHEAARIEQTAQSFVSVEWFGQFQVRQDPDSPGASVAGVRVSVRNATGEIIKATTGADGITPILRFLHWTQKGTAQPSVSGPLTVIANQAPPEGTNYTQAEHTVTRNRLAPDDPMELLLPVNPDVEPPAWPPAGAGLGATGSVGFSASGQVDLGWSGAVDNRGVDKYEVQIVGPGVQTVEFSTRNSHRFTGLQNGTFDFRVRAHDFAGLRTELSPPLRIVVDREVPWHWLTANRTSGSKAWNFNRSFEVELHGIDNRSGLARLEYQMGDDPWREFDENLTFADEGRYDIKARAVDNAGGTTERTFRVVLDKKAPLLTLRTTPSIPEGLGGWFSKEPTVAFLAEDQGSAGVHAINYRIGGTGAWKQANQTLKVSAAGDHQLYAEAVDGAGNRALTLLRLPVDLRPPEVKTAVVGRAGTNGWHTGPVFLFANATDDASGVSRLEYRVDDGAWAEFASPLQHLRKGEDQVSIRSIDRAGNIGEAKAFDLKLDDEPPILPTGDWRAVGEGLVRVDWTTGLAGTDLISQLANAFVDYGGTRAVLERSTPFDPRSSQISLGPFSVGKHAFRFRLVDGAGNEATSPWTYVDLDASTGAPLEVTGVKRARGLVFLQYHAANGFQPVEVSYFLKDQLLASYTEPPFEHEWDTVLYPDSTYELHMVARDSSGRIQEKVVTYETRNSYSHLASDAVAPLTFAILPPLIGAVTATFGAIAWRRRLFL